MIGQVLYSEGQAVNRHAQLLQFQEAGQDQGSGDEDEREPEAEWIQWPRVDWEQEGFARLAWWPYLSLITWQEGLYSENLNQKSRLPIAYFITSTFLGFSIPKEFAVQLYVSQSQGQFKNSKSKLKLCEYNQNYLLEISAPCQFDHGNQETKNEFKLQSFEPISIAQTNVVGIHCLLLLIWLATNVEVALVTTLYIFSLFQC